MRTAQEAPARRQEEVDRQGGASCPLSRVTRYVLLAFCLLLSALSLPAAWPCGPEPFPSVHFNWNDPNFSAPARPLAPVEERGPRRWVQRSYRWEETEAQEYAHLRRVHALLLRAQRLERLGQSAEALRAYERYQPFEWGKQAGLRDRIEVLRQVTNKTDSRLLKLYLRAREFYDDGRLTEAQGVMQRVHADRRAGFLKPHALYALASLEYDWGHLARAATLYQQLLREHPKSVKREAALIMAARCLLRSPPQPHVWGWVDSPLPSSAAVRRGRALLKQLLKEYPNTRFRVNALGWMGRCEYVSKRYAEAMCLYLKQFAAATTEEESRSGMLSLRFTHERMSAQDARRFTTFLFADQGLIVPYLDYRLYHCDNEPSDFANLDRLARAFVRRQQLPPAIAVALAEICHHRREYRGCLQWARRALAASRPGEHRARRDLAYYLRGAARYKLKQPRAALTDFETVLRDFPQSYLCPAAHENLALLYEARGNLATALDHYFALGYEADIAFLLDARMTTAEIERLIAARPRHPKRDLLLYSLGMRYLRAGNLDRAERTFRRLPPRRVKELSRDCRHYWDFDDQRRFLSLLHNPLTTLRELRHLEADLGRAPTANAKADALYALASYYYRNRDLLLYNAPLWRGYRTHNFGWFWNGSHATKQDNAAAHKHHYEHECLNRAREICLYIVRHYPRSLVAPQAMYRAACCARRLADFNDWWRSENSRHDFWAEAARLMKEVSRRYPKHPLAATARKYAQVFQEEKPGNW